MDKETMRMKLTYWSGIIKEARASGMKISVRAFSYCPSPKLPTPNIYQLHYFSLREGVRNGRMGFRAKSFYI